MSVTTAESPAAGKPMFSAGYKGVVLSFLLAAYTFNFIDRTIIATIGPAIMKDLSLTSTQMGLLGGLYFALLYTLLGIPIARFAERFNRVNIIAASLVIWSAFTALCGIASSYVMLAAFRFGVGIGEAGCSPPAHSLISDYYEPRKRASALSIYAFGIPLGTMFGAVAGGWLAENLGWRVAFMALGLPGIILAILFKLMVKEPPRGWSDAEARREDGRAPEVIAPKPPFSFGEEFREMAGVAKTLFTKWPVVNMVLGVTIASFGSYGSGQFVPQYFVGAFGLSLATVGLITGLVGGFSSGIGTLLGGFISDRLSKRSPAWYALTPAFGLAIAAPIYIAAYLAPSWQMTAAILLIPGIFHYTYLGPTFGVVQNSVDTRRRATATAVLFFFLNLIALGGGPPFIGWVIDQLSQGTYAAEGLRSFATDCPGGRAPEGAGAALVDACRTAWVGGTRNGIIVGFFFYAWASLHYFLAAIGMAKHMRERAAIQAAN